MFKPTVDELKEILEKHKKWAFGEEGGVRANLSRAYLSRANLSGANLSDANLSGADLSDAYLSDAYLSDAYLSDANLSRANLSRANLSGANLSDAYLSDAYLSDADLSDAYLSDADLSDADLSDANLSRANLSRANLSRANLSRAYLSGADLSDANLSDADLSRANLSGIKDDFFKILDSAPSEVPGVLAALNAGKVDGSTYEGPCACLVGTVANLRGCHYEDIPGIEPDSYRPAERWFFMIRKGSTPENNQAAAITKAWIEEWIAAHPVAEVTA